MNKNRIDWKTWQTGGRDEISPWKKKSCSSSINKAKDEISFVMNGLNVRNVTWHTLLQKLRTLENGRGKVIICLLKWIIYFGTKRKKQNKNLIKLIHSLRPHFRRQWIRADLALIFRASFEQHLKKRAIPYFKRLDLYKNQIRSSREEKKQTQSVDSSDHKFPNRGIWGFPSLFF